jgi:hypothetical protein
MNPTALDANYGTNIDGHPINLGFRATVGAGPICWFGISQLLEQLL